MSVGTFQKYGTFSLRSKLSDIEMLVIYFATVLTWQELIKNLLVYIRVSKKNKCSQVYKIGRKFFRYIQKVEVPFIQKVNWYLWWFFGNASCRVIQTESFKLMEKLLQEDYWLIISFCMHWSNSNCSFTLVVIFSSKQLSQNIIQFNFIIVYFKGAFFYCIWVSWKQYEMDNDFWNQNTLTSHSSVCY